MVNDLARWIAVAVLGAPLVFSVVVAAAGTRWRKYAWIGGSAATLALTVLQAWRVTVGGTFESLGGEVRVDGLAAIMSMLIAFLAFVCSVYAFAYMPGTHANEPGRHEQLQRRMPLFTVLFLILECTLFWTVMTNNIVLLWVALEATTLASVMLVSFYWDARALEAGYKYLLLLTVGITSAFFGCVLLYAAAAPHLGSDSALLISNLSRVADRIPPNLAIAATLLLLIGFGTKAGLAPFHPWVADAHAEAPAVMSAFLSSVIIKVPFVGMIRIWSVFGPRYPALDEAMLWLGAFTMIIGAALAVAQDDLKRLHAYSSVSQVGFIAVALGLGPPLGYYAAVFFLVSHALTKGLLFLSTGAVVFAAHERRSLSALGGLRRRMPLTAACALIGALSLAGMPPFSGFLAKAQVAFAAADAHAWVVLGIAAGAALVTMAYMIGMVQRVFLGRPAPGPELDDVREVPYSMRWAMAMLAAAVLAIGLQPQWLDPLLDAVARM